MDCNQINKALLLLPSKLNRAIASCITLRNRRSFQNNKPKWWNSATRVSFLAKTRANVEYIVTKSKTDKTEHDRFRRNTKKLIKQNKRNFEVCIADINNSNLREFYCYLEKKKYLHQPFILQNGNHTGNEIIMADILNNVFATIFTVEDIAVNHPSHTIRMTTPTLTRVYSMKKNILHTISNIEINKTSGPDKISQRIPTEAKRK